MFRLEAIWRMSMALLTLRLMMLIALWIFSSSSSTVPLLKFAESTRPMMCMAMPTRYCWVAILYFWASSIARMKSDSSSSFSPMSRIWFSWTNGVFAISSAIVVEDRGQRVEDRGAQASVEHDIESRQVDLYEAVVVVSRT